MSDALEHRTPQMNSPGGRREAQAAIIWNRGSCAPTERSVKGFSRLRRRAKRALDRPFGRRVPVTVPNNGGPWPWRLCPESFCDSNCESDALVGGALDRRGEPRRRRQFEAVKTRLGPAARQESAWSCEARIEGR